MTDRWNPKHFGYTPFQVESTGQLTIWWDSPEPPDPDDYKNLKAYEKAWQQWIIQNPGVF